MTGVVCVCVCVCVLLLPADAKCSLSIIHLDEDRRLDSGSYVVNLFSFDSGQLCVFPSMINWFQSGNILLTELLLLLLPALRAGEGEIKGSMF